MKLTENTLIPVGLAVIVIGGGAAWITNIQMSTAATVVKITSMEEKSDKVMESLAEIQNSLAEVKGELKQLNKGNKSWQNQSD